MVELAKFGAKNVILVGVETAELAVLPSGSQEPR